LRHTEVTDIQSDLTGRWYHSFEEDHDGIRVYRPRDFEFPPARGRGGVEFDADGSFVDWGPGAGDAPQGRPGSWQVDAGLEHLELTVGDWRRTVEVVSAEPDKLELRIGIAP
jgi:hypothetical protein